MDTNLKKNNEVAITRNDNSVPLSVVDVTNGNLPDLTDAKEFPLDLMSDYWTPETRGESKRVFFDSVRNRKVIDQQSGEIIELPCAFFYEKKGEDVKTISNGSKRLVGIFEGGDFERGTPFLITYLGKKKNATNGFQSDTWSVKPLIITIK
jgi:hypothetical protein